MTEFAAYQRFVGSKLQGVRKLRQGFFDFCAPLAEARDKYHQLTRETNMNIKLNENYKNLKASYLFSEIGRRVREYSAAHPEQKIIRLGIGDVTLPLSPVVCEAMRRAVGEMEHKDTFRGYAP